NGKTETVEATPTWNGNTYTYTGLDKYDDDGYEYTYTVTEVQINGYDAPMQDGFNFTNPIHDPEDVTISGTKTWIDGDKEHYNADEIVLTLTRTANGKTETVNVTPVWDGSTYTYSNLEKYDENGYEYVYTVTESPIVGYTTEQDGYNFTNTLNQEYQDIAVVKVWIDDDNRDGVRPDRLAVTLSDGTVIYLDENGNWRATVSNLPKYKDSREPIEYTWTEEDIPEYELISVVEENGVTTFTNRHVSATTALSVRKVWNDDNNRDGLRPTELVVELYADGEPTGITVTLNEENGWSATINELPANKAGSAISYTWVEPEIEGYTLITTDDNGVIVLTNTHVPATTALTVVKVWNDDNNRDGLRPESLTVTLLANNVRLNTVTLSDANNWTATINNLPVNENGKPIQYTWTEPDIPGYTLTNRNTVVNTTTLTNTHVPETVERTIVKVWVDNGYPARPASLTMILFGGDLPITVTLNEANNWQATVTGLPKYRDGVEIVYTWRESDVTGYTQTNYVTNDTVTTITNTRVPPEENDTVYTLTIYYRYLDGRPAAPTVIQTHHEGDPYDVVSPHIDGYTATILRVTGIQPNRDIEYVVIYIPNNDPNNPFIIIDDFETPLGLGQVFINVGDCLE
ncbi:MAG: Cna B-type domain-containing protein, partial [Clostridia bacterium]|nr:Cna B-type domain-containing protein [Clostridia bacterium]